MPLQAVGLIDRTSGKDLLPGTGGTQVLELREEQATFRELRIHVVISHLRHIYNYTGILSGR
jgi:hypothetical protein